ncbi:MAG: acetylornithine/succinylornithine family transaminase [Actinobacteria bacterium]|nr:acetylornithine/succinylornithine family transaminase [Actinomycetota bacterium]
MTTFGPTAVTFVHGSGVELFDTEGKRYLDFLGGIAVTALGHSYPPVADAIAEQAHKLVHVSNYFGNEHHEEAARLLDGILGGGGRVFFTNSGAEANECALKLARRWGGRGRHVVVSAYGSFHGRTLATLHATGQPEKHEAFQPLPEGFRHVAWSDIDALEASIDPSVAAVFLEPIQGEGGVNEADRDYFRSVRALCDERGLLLIADEIQTGLGRTGEWFGLDHHGIRADVVTVAKALGNGFPVGACWARAEVADAYRPGDHGTTFGGQPLAAVAARTTLQEMIRLDVPAKARRAGDRLRSRLEALEGVASVRGDGLLLAAELADGVDAAQVYRSALGAGLIVNAVRPTTLRFAPSLLVTDDEIDEAVGILDGVLATFTARSA